MPVHHLSQSFNAGLLSTYLDARFNVEKYASGCREMENFIPQVHGPAVKRPGLEYLGAAHVAGLLNDKNRLVGFNMGDGLSYIVELAVRQIRIWRDGALLALDATITHTYDESQLFDIKIERANDVAWLVHPDHPVRRLERHSNTDWRLTEVTWDWPAMLDENLTDTTLSLSAVAGTGVDMTASADLFFTEHVGSYWQIAHRRDAAFTKIEMPIYPAASSVLVLSGNPSNGEVFSVDGAVYAFRTAAAVANDVTIGVDAAATVTNIIAAIEADPDSTGYGIGTARHPTVTASDGGSTASATKAVGILTSDGNPDLTGNSSTPNCAVRIDFGAFANEYRFDSAGSMGPFVVREGPTATDSLKNLVAAINATGTAGVQYGAGTTAHTTVTAALTSANQITITAKTGGVAGDAIITQVIFAAAPNRLKFGSPTLTGGAAGATSKVKFFARKQGVAGNDITVSESATNVTWSNTPNFIGGVDYATESEPLRVQGSWNFTTYGIWQGTVSVEKQNPDGSWTAIRTWTGDKNRPNFIGSGTEDEEGTLRIKLTEAAGESASNADVPRFILEANDPKVYGFVKVTDYVSATQVKVTVLDEVWDLSATTFWSEGAWSTYRGYPKAVCFHEQRLIFAGTTNDPGTFWGSVTGDFQNFRRSSLDDGSFAYQIASFDTQSIQWLASKNDLIIGTSMGEWKAGPGPQGTAITPTDVNVKWQSAHGSNGVQAVRAQEALVYVSRNGRKVRQMLYDDGRQSYGSANLTILAEQVTEGGIVQIAVQSQQDSIIWAVTGDGRLIAMTYEVEQNVFAWSEHTTEGLFESVAVINGEDADEIWVVVNRSGVRSVERFHVVTQSLDRADYTTLCYVDAGVVADAGSLVTAYSTGLSHLNGKEVQILGDGSYQGIRTVVGGSVAIDPPARYLTIGLGYASRLMVMKPDIPLRNGTSRTRHMQVVGALLQVKESLGGSVKAAEDWPEEELVYQYEPVADEPPDLQTGMVETNIQGEMAWSADTIVIHDEPLPFTLVALAQRIECGSD